MSDYVFPNTLTPVAEWTPVPQIEANTPAKGGPGEPDNAQAQALANRLQYLRQVEIPTVVADAVAGIGGGSGGGGSSGFITLVPSSDMDPYDGNLVYWDVSLGKKARINVATPMSCKLAPPTNLQDGDELILRVCVYLTGFYFDDTIFVWPNGGSPTWDHMVDPDYSASLFRFVYDAEMGRLIGQQIPQIPIGDLSFGTP